MRSFRITFKLDTLINFDDPFLINDISFYYQDKQLYAKTIIEEIDVMKAQEKAWSVMSPICSVIGFKFRYPLGYHINNIEELNDDGTVCSTMSSIEGSLYVRKKITKDNIDELIILSELIEKNSEFKRVMLYANRPDFKSWVGLYKIYEIIDSNAGIKKNSWLSEKKRNLFRRSANHPVASGFNARHAVQKEEPPQNPMELEEAIELINELIIKWKEYLIRNP